MALLLTEAEVRELLTPRELIDAMESALAGFSAGDVTQPVRTALQIGPRRNYFGVMPAHIPAHLATAATLGVKLVSAFDENTARGLPTHLATIVLLNPETGALEAVMDGRYITAVRTAAVSAAAVRRLAREDARVLTILGSGVQARSHAELLPEGRRFREIRAWSPTPGNLQRFVSDAASATRIPARAVASAEEAVRGAEVIVLATSSAQPVIRSPWVDAGALVISVGACRPDMREIDPELTARARLIVDSRAAALVEAGDIVLGIREGRWRETHIAGELGEVILGRVAGRTAEDEVVVFKSLGLAVEDVAAAHLAFERAREKRKGREVSL
jgi:ornithine cyclodeaminase/alanine dehydrogenase-like protein (mu-crystallin family)